MREAIKQRALPIVERLTPRAALVLAIAVFAVMKIILMTRFHMPIWDEAVYLTMGKYALTGGALGYWEALRAPVLPLILAVLQGIGNPIVLGEALQNLAAITGAVLLFKIAKRHTSEWIAVLAAALLLFANNWFTYSSLLLTGVISATLMLLAAYLDIKDKPLLAGLASAIAFLTRWPAGLIIAGIGGYRAALAIISWYKAKGPVLDEATKRVLWYALGVGIPVSLWMMANWIAWSQYVDAWWHAAIRPLILGAANIYSTEGLYDATTMYYFRHFIIYLPVTIASLWGLWRLKEHQEIIPLALSAVLGLAYFTDLQHNEWRFALIMVPGVIILTAIALEDISKRHRYARTAVILLLLINIGFLVAEDAQLLEYRTGEEPVIMDFYRVLQDRPVEGLVLVNDPVAGWYAPNRVEPIWYEHLPRFRQMLQQPHDAVVFAPHNFICAPTDDECNEVLRYLVDHLTTSERLVAQQKWLGHDWYLFSTKEWYTPLDASALRSAHNLSSGAELSNKPYDTMPVVLVLEDFPSLNDTLDGVWHEQRYDRFVELFSDRNVTAAVIPTHLIGAMEMDSTVAEDLEGFAIAQNGYNHESLPGRSQFTEMALGKAQISQVLGREPTAFIPPYYAADQGTAQAVDKLGFKAYISTPADNARPATPRLDHTNSLVRNWELQELAGEDDIMADLESLSRHNADYAMMSAYYFMYNESQAQELSRTLERIGREYLIATPAQTARWLQDRSLVELSIDEGTLLVHSPVPMEGLTVLLHSDVQYSLDTDAPLLFKNGADEPVTACIDSVCDTVEPGYFFFNRSAIVNEPLA